MLIGYARVSTSDQTLNLQKDALEKNYNQYTLEGNNDSNTIIVDIL